MKEYLAALFLSCFLFSGCISGKKKNPDAKNGYLNLSEWDFERNGNVALDGAWEFYWNSLYTPEDFDKDSLIEKTGFIEVPSNWNRQIINNQKFPGKGFATYRLKIKLNRSCGILGIKLLDFSSSYKLWINKNLVATNGNVSSVLSEIKPQLLPQTKTFIANSDSLEVIVQIANNFHFKGGLWQSVLIGTSDQISKARENDVIFTMFLAGTLFILFIYHVWIFIFRRKEKASLWFGILCFAILIRTLLVNERILYYFFFDFNLNIGYRIEYLVMFITPLIYGLYFFNLFEKSFSKIGLKIIAVISIIETIIVLFASTRFYTSIAIIIQSIMYIEFVYFFMLTFFLIAKRKHGAVLFLLSWIILLISGMNDILYNYLIINTFQIAHYAFFIFLVTQAYILSNKIAGAFNTVEDLSINLEQKVVERTHELAIEKMKSDNLLLNILPGEVAEELKEKGSADAKQFDEVTVMFTDFKNFTQISERLTPTELVADIHYFFKAFDDIIESNNIEKIKTIGDSYMCAGGLPVMNKTNAIDVVTAALEIQNFMQQHSAQRKIDRKEIFEIRIGIHTGPVVAGIVGVKKFAYDIWGDTVNIASRMEDSGEAGKVNISGSTYELVKDKFNCIHRGKIQAKNKGEIDMYFVEV